jgi:GTP:adenosylcobinamide-phosphate guanylyltransferase
MTLPGQVGEGARLFTALVLAGSRGSADPVASAAGLPHKALVPVAGRPMLLRVIDTLRQCPEIGRIVLCLEDLGLPRREPELAFLLAEGKLSIVPAARSPAASVLAVLETLPDAVPLLVATADHPLLTPEMIRHFLSSLGGAEAAAAVASESVIAAAYPETKRTYIRLSDGGYSGCNLFAFTDADAAAAARFWTKVERYRKQPWRLFAAAGPRALLSFLLGRLDLAAAAERLSRVLGLRLRVVTMPFAEAAIDVDKPSDLALVEKILAARGQRCS